jgi:uncharacterized protein (TIGR02117 family)
MKRLWRIGQYVLGATFSSAALLTIGYFTPTQWQRSTRANCIQNTEKIYVVGDDVHTNIIVPVQNEVFDWQTQLSLQNIGADTTANYRYLAFGWGERNFYMNTPTPADFRLSNALKALFLINKSVLYVQGLPTYPAPNANVRCLRINQADYLKLMEHIDRTFEQNPQGEKIRLQNGYTPNGGFYASKGRYSILRTCNTWTAEGLRQANVNTPVWAGLSSAVMLHLENSCQCD